MHSLTVSTNLSSFSLSISVSPPRRIVYQRIIKPHPTLTLSKIGGYPAPGLSLFVDVALVRADDELDVPAKIFEKESPVRVDIGTNAVFRRLKILDTSQRQGSHFRLKFSLASYHNGFSLLPVSVLSEPIEVVSHTQYINPKTERKILPCISFVLFAARS